jgi:hypothetical protein
MNWTGEGAYPTHVKRISGESAGCITEAGQA